MILRVRWVEKGGHTHCRVFMGATDASLGKCGELTFTNGEFQLLRHLAARLPEEFAVTFEFREEE